MSFPVQPTIDCPAFVLSQERRPELSVHAKRQAEDRPGPASHESVFEGRTSTASMLKIVCLWGILTSGNGKLTNFEWKNHQFLMEDHQCLMENHQFLMEKTQVFF